MNFSLSSLCLSRAGYSPLFSRPASSRRTRLSVSSSRFSRFSSGLLLSRSCRESSAFLGTTFSRFLGAVLRLDATIERVGELLTNETILADVQEDVLVSECKFNKCFALEGEACCIVNNGETYTSQKLTVEKTSFVMCLGGSLGGAIYYFGSEISITKSCFNFVWAQERFQAYFLCSTGQGIMNLCSKDQCSPKYPIGQSFVEHLRCANTSVTEGNNTRCSVKERRACASFGKNRFLKYQWMVNTNNSGQTMFGFQLDTNEDYLIADCVCYRCSSTTHSIGLIETGKPIIIQRFTFFQMKSLFAVIDDQENAGFPMEAEALFVDCVTDVRKEKYTLSGKNITLMNLSLVSRGVPPKLDVSLASWMCQTDIPRTMYPTVSSTPFPTITPTLMPSMTVPILDNKDRGENEPELVELEKVEDRKIFTKGDMIQLAVLIALAIITAAVFVLASKKKRNPALPTAEEKEHLLQY